MKIGVLGLQGDYARHFHLLRLLEMEPVLVRYARNLEQVCGLVIPGGESTTMTKLIASYNLYQPLIDFAREKPVLGTCAGLIMLGQQIEDERVRTLGLIDVDTVRNAYGRQVDSFSDNLIVSGREREVSIPATFIRAPRITRVGTEVEVLAEHQGKPVAVRQGKHMGLSFHPELDEVTIFHDLAFAEQSIPVAGR